ncbi:MAG: DNA replication/repair protein RecF [Leptospiraceae bacterium]|nr:DNA replication/repair protein RecF [Leptospiraceae bacterium]
MRVRHLKLANFRVFESLDLDFEGDIIFFIGQNGMGKTSILEAISVIALVRSFRQAKDQDLIRWGEEHYAVSADIKEDSQNLHLHAAYGLKQGRRLLVNREKVTKLADYMGRLPLVVFSPEDLEIVQGGPQERRRFLDIVLSTLMPLYLESLQKYQRVLKQRNALLQRLIRDPLMYRALDEELARLGAILIQKRREFVQNYLPNLKNYLHFISNGQDNWEMTYQPSIPEGDEPMQYLKTLEKGFEYDLKTKKTNWGIHRDRLLFHPPQKPETELLQIASQGQKRTLVLALKMAQYSYFTQVLNKIPLLLVDDVLNELDLSRRQAFVRFLQSVGQAFFTTTDLGEMHTFLREKNLAMAVEVFTLSKKEKEQNKTVVVEKLPS